METFVCSTCKQELPARTEDGLFGNYGIDRNDQKQCYACIGKIEGMALANARKFEKFVHYLTKENGQWRVTNWPGTLIIQLGYVKEGRHNIAGKRYDFWFRFSNREFWGVCYGDNTQIAHIRCIKVIEHPEPDTPGRKMYDSGDYDEYENQDKL